MEPISKGGLEGKSWHADLNNGSSLTDVADLAGGDGGLLSLGDYYESANELKVVEAAALAAHETFNVNFDAKALARSKNARASLCITRCEALLVRLFSPDSISHYSAEERDTRVRRIKSMCTKHARWGGVFKPILARATDAMALI